MDCIVHGVEKSRTRLNNIHFHDSVIYGRISNREPFKSMDLLVVRKKQLGFWKMGIRGERKKKEEMWKLQGNFNHFYFICNISGSVLSTWYPFTLKITLRWV